MFTGIITEIGKIKSIQRNSDGIQLCITAEKILLDMQLGDSISINGVCQTITKINNNCFFVDAINETLKKTTFGSFYNGQLVNLEPAITLNTRLGGHFVQGHIDTTGNILQIIHYNQSFEYLIDFPTEFRKYLARTGAIAIDGVSLTTANIYDTSFRVAIIPHTINSTILKHYKIGYKVNLEFDILGKYIESMLRF